jgi:hypothetical protein
MGNAEGVIQIELACFATQKALGDGGAFFKDGALCALSQDFTDRRRKDLGLVEFPLEAAPEIKRDRHHAIVGSQRGTAREEGVHVRGKDLKEVTASFKLDFVKNLLNRALIAKEGPGLIARSQRNPDALFRRREFEFLKTFTARKTQPPLLKFQKPVTSGTTAGIKKS